MQKYMITEMNFREAYQFANNKIYGVEAILTGKEPQEVLWEKLIELSQSNLPASVKE